MPGYLYYARSTLLKVFVQLFGVFMLSQFRQCFCFDLTNALTCDSKLLANFFESMALGVIQAKSHGDNFLFTVQRPGPGNYRKMT